MVMHKTGKPKAFRNAQKKFGQVPVNPDKFESTIFGWQSKSFRNKDAYLKVKQTADSQDIFLIDISPLETLPDGKLNVFFLDSQSRISPSDMADEVQKVDSEYFPRFETLSRVPHDRRLMFFTKDNPVGDGTNGEITDTTIYTIYEILEKRHANGKFKLTEMTLQNAVGLTGKNESGQYVENVFIKDPAGAEAADEIEITFESFVFISQIQVFDRDTGSPITLTIENNDDLDTLFVEPKVNRGQVSFNSKEVGEIRFMRAAFNSIANMGGYGSYISTSDENGTFPVGHGKLDPQRCIPKTRYAVKDKNQATPFELVENLQKGEIWFAFTPENNLSIVGKSIGFHKWDDIDWSPRPWESHNGKYVCEYISIDNANWARDGYDFIALSEVVPNPNMDENVYKDAKNSFINGTMTWNGIDFIEKFDNPLTTVDKDPEFANLDPNNPADRSYQVLTFVDSMQLIDILENVPGALTPFTYVEEKVYTDPFKSDKYKYPETVGAIGSHIPQDPFLSKVYCESKGFPTMNKIRLSLGGEYAISQIKILSYGGQKIHIRQLLNGNDAVQELIFDAPSIRGSADSTLLNITFALPEPLNTGEMTIEELIKNNYS